MRISLKSAARFLSAVLCSALLVGTVQFTDLTDLTKGSGSAAVSVSAAGLDAGEECADSIESNQAASSSVNVGLTGSYYVNIQEALDRINAIRYEACREGVKNPADTSKNLTLSDYHPIKWSSELERVARQRAAEAAVAISHNRPDGSGWSDLPSTVFNCAEVIAWYWSTNMVNGIDMFYGEKSAWVNNTGAVTGHYTAMINPRYTYIGLGLFSCDSVSYRTTLCGRFATATGLDETKGKAAENTTVTIAVKPENIKNPSLVSATGKDTVDQGGTLKFTLNADLDYPGKGSVNVQNGITWKSSDESIMTVSGGTVTGKKAGSAVLKATVGSVTASYTVKVLAAETISLDKTSLTLEKGKSATLKATVTLPNGGSSAVTWSSSNTGVATVSSGNVTAVAEGTATITAKSAGGKTAACKVTVTKPSVPVTSVKLNTTSLTLGVGQTYTLKATVAPSNATDKTVTWSTSNSKVVTCKNGALKAAAAGSAKITVKSKNGKTATCSVTVKAAPSKITLSPASATLGVGEKIKLKVSLPSGSYSPIKFTTSSSSVCTVDSSGNIQAKKKGTATITAKTFNGKSATCKVTVKAAPSKITLDKTSVTIKKGKTYKLVSSVPSSSASYTRTFTSSNTSICTVNGSGVVTAKKAGSATVTVKTYNGKTAKCKVTVKS